VADFLGDRATDWLKEAEAAGLKAFFSEAAFFSRPDSVSLRNISASSQWLRERLNTVASNSDKLAANFDDR